jgi:hypothetical protein
MRCLFSDYSLNGGDIRLDGQVVPIKDTFQYLGLTLQSDGGINEDISHRLRAGWVK